ncbi:single-stranded DNA-binding protein [Kribbella sp. CA-253562]|uniref:single-stranded DNA-binding protein n=1 Tax=Kribbella sp. CA-253562 TaxID=3239942 RepID=UPI003D8DB493
MSNDAYLTLTGRVGGDVQLKQVNGGHALATFRIGSTARAYDRDKADWVDRPTTWFSVECWRGLAQNVAESIGRGDPVVVYGRLKTTEWTEDGESRSRTVLEAFSVGHDLSRGVTTFSKATPQGLGARPSPFDDLPQPVGEANPLGASEAA